jgi:signal transduction histidine kinase
MADTDTTPILQEADSAEEKTGEEKTGRSPHRRRRRLAGSRVAKPNPEAGSVWDPEGESAVVVAPPSPRGRSLLPRWTPGFLSSWGLSPTFRVFIFLGSIVGVMSFLLYTEYLIREFRIQERDRAELYARLYALAPSLPPDDVVVQKVVMNPISFPLIVTNHRGEVTLCKGPGLPALSDASEEELAALLPMLLPIVERMDAANPPIRIFPDPKAYGRVYFDGESLIITGGNDEVFAWAGLDLPDPGDTSAVALALVGNAQTDLASRVVPRDLTIPAQSPSFLYFGGEAFAVTDARGKLLAWGGAGMPPSEDFSAAALAEVKAQVQRISRLEVPQSFRIRTETYFHYDDSELISRISLAPFVTVGVLLLFALVGYVGFRNIRRSEQRSIWVGMAKETAHQLGTPLSSLAGWLELMETHRERVEESGDSITAEMRKDVARLTQIASRFSQIGSVPELAPGDVRRVLTETVSYFENRGPQFGRHSFETDFEEVPDVLVNEELMGWALENLLKNSIDAIGGRDGRIAVSVRPPVDGNYVRITIQDNGRGIEPENAARVFEPGFSTKKRGWGLGLAFVKRIVEEYHCGRIHIARSEAGEGTAFEILLPAA